MRQERFANHVATTLNGGINGSVTTVVVLDGSTLPAEGDFRIIVESEIMLVTARSTNSLTVVRGQEGTAGVTHSTAVDVRTVLTAGALKQYWSDFNTLYLPDATPPKRVFNSSGVPIGESSFTWYNQSTATAVDQTDDSILLTTPESGTGNWRGKYVTPPSAPWTLTAAFSICWANAGVGSFPQSGITVENSGDGKLTTLSYHFKTGYSPGIQVSKLNSYTSYNSAYVDLKPLAASSKMIWMRFEDDNTFHKQSISIDGVKWLLLNSVSRTNWLSNGGDRVGFGNDVGSDTGQGFTYLTYLKHWSWS